MLNNEKIRLMTRLAMYESKEGKEDIKLSNYFKTDYVRFQTIKTVVAVTFGYCFVLLMVALYNADFLIKEAVRLDYAMIGRIVLVGYLGLIVIYAFASMIGYSIYYSKSRQKLSKYFKLLRKLRNMYKGELKEDKG